MRYYPGGLAPGFSGSSVTNYTISPPAVTGIHSGSPDLLVDTIPYTKVDTSSQVDLALFYSRQMVAAKISTITKFSAPALMAAIKKYCSKKSDSASTEILGKYKHNVKVENAEGTTGLSKTDRSLARQAWKPLETPVMVLATQPAC